MTATLAGLRRSMAAACAAVLALSACGGTGGATGGEGADDGIEVMAGFYPLEWAAAQVGGDRVFVRSLTPPGAEAHDLELTPQDVGSVAEADLVVYLAGFQPALDEAVESEAGDRGWDAGEAADLSPTAEGDHADEGEHVDEGEHADSAVDPHFWLDPVRLAAVGDALAARLGELDPDGASAYEENAAALRGDLEDLDSDMRAALDDCQVPTLVTSHDAFGYLGERYGFEVVGISGLSPSEEPNPGQLAEIATLVRDRGITTIYTETLVDPAVAETVAAEAGATTAVLDPLEGLTGESSGGDYFEVMRANLDVLAGGQSCT